MEYFLCRALEVCRVGHEELIKLHVHEKNIGRCLLPAEIQDILALAPLKEHYQIPDHDPSQSAHNQRLRGEFRINGLIPKHGDFVLTEIGDIHNFDERVRIINDDLKINLTFRSTKGARKKISEEFE